MSAVAEQAAYINDQAIFDCLSHTAQPEPARVRDLFAKAREMQGLTFDEVATLIALQDPELTEELFHTARAVKEEIYGSRLVMFAPLYISIRCTNECNYCARCQTGGRLLADRSLSRLLKDDWPAQL